MTSHWTKARLPIVKFSLLAMFAIPVLTDAVSQNQEEPEYRIIPSLTDWIEEINNSPGEVYRESYLKILFNPDKDSNFIMDAENEFSGPYDTLAEPLVINKSVSCFYIQFDEDRYRSISRGLRNLHFKDDFRIYYLQNHRFGFRNVTFDSLCQVRLMETLFWLDFADCTFKEVFRLNNPLGACDLHFTNCHFQGRMTMSSNRSNPALYIRNCQLDDWLSLGQSSMFNVIVIQNSSVSQIVDLQRMQIENSLEIFDSRLGGIDIDGTNLPESNTYIPFEQISGKIRYTYWEDGNIKAYSGSADEDLSNKAHYDRLVASYAKLQNAYQARSEMDSYNACYAEMRQLQTAYSRVKYKEEPSFANYTVYQLNVFMSAFSDYGTRPTKAIIISVYVVLFFALIYLFFPNSWDPHGRDRIIDRYKFFLKYLQRDSGIHQVYLEEKQQQMMSYEEFRDMVKEAENKVPSFFIATGLPLYRWAISGNKLAAAILKRFDVVEGTWEDTRGTHRFWKGTLITGAFTIAILFDIAIKMLNALMLSLNTFTTLGFGEIPLTGLPRYLAIIEGLIGWFMLTVFSVSLISQVLN